MARPPSTTHVSLSPAALAGALLALVTPPLFAAACSTPSSTLDGGDLLGVFSHDAGAADAAHDGGRHDGRKHDAGLPPALTDASVPDASVRQPIEGSCVAVQGERTHETGRMMGRPACRNAEVREWKDADGAPRYACVFTPPGVETRAPLPLVIFFHDGAGNPTEVDKKTGLRKLGGTFPMSEDPAHLGFIVLAPQGRALRKGMREGLFEAEYTGPDNVDVAAVDHFEGELEAKGLVDKTRIYTVGASLGGKMAATYAMMRPDKVAAFAVYATDEPPAVWSCSGPPPPGMVAYRACDNFVACASVERWLRARDALGAETGWLRLGEAAEDEPNCGIRNKCTPKRGEGAHLAWPKTREADMLKFLARHAFAGR